MMANWLIAARRRIVCRVAISIVLLSSSLSGRAAEKSSPPNFLFIMADDLGWADVDYHGGKTPTPHLNSLRQQSLELTQHYSYPVCSPTRSSLLSGRYASRFGVTNPQNPRAYRWPTVTLPRALKTVGYQTALCGKWHLGSNPDWGPQKFGFDHSYGSLAGGVGPYDHRYKKGEFTQTWHRNGVLFEEPGHVTDLITNEAIEWLNKQGAAPFFLYVPYTAVHIPIREPKEFVDAIDTAIADPAEREYAASIAHLDASVGRLLEALQKTGKCDNTIVVFTSDNGGIATAKNNDTSYPEDGYASGVSHGNNKPLRNQKGSVYEGGTRTGALVRWPSRLKPGQCDALVHISDWMPTFCKLAGYEPTASLGWDGRDLGPVFNDGKWSDQRSIYIVGPNARSTSFRRENWKLVVQSSGTGNSAGETERIELFNIALDPTESKDLTSEEATRVNELRNQMKQVATADRDAVADDQ